MKKNETYDIVCTDLSRKGYGVVHVDGMSVFVNGLLPEEKAKIKIIKVFKTYAIAIVEKLYEKSDIRTEPLCPKAKSCGGCQLQMIKYSAQLKQKQQWLEHLFKNADPDIIVYPVIGMEYPYFYRNKAQFPVKVENGQIKMGFYRAQTNNIVDIEKCYIQSEEINKIFKWLKDHMDISVAENLKHIFIRAAKTTKEVQVVFIGTSDKGLKKLAQQLVKDNPEVVSVLFNENLRKDNVILGDTYKILFGKDWILEESLGNKIQLHFKSFFQVNPEQTKKLYKKAIDLAKVDSTKKVIDMYSGTGTIALAMSKFAKEVIGVEIVKEAVDNAKENAKINNIHNVTFICEDASKFAADFNKNHQKADIVMVDPPRKGLSEEGIKDICQIAPEQIVYISCNPETLARDIKRFKEEGYMTKTIQPVDMFAQTTQVECIANIYKEN